MLCKDCNKREINILRSKRCCDICLDKRIASQRGYYKSHRKQEIERSMQLGKVRIERLLSKGLCINCGKRPISISRSKNECDYCLDKGKQERKENYYPNNKKKIQAGQRRSVQKNHQKYLDIKKKYYHAHKEKYEQWMTERRGRVLGVEGKFTRKEWKELLNYCGNKCLKCGATTRLEADHIIPISIGGSNNIDNIQPLCRSCNAQKHVDIVDYRPYIDWT